MARVFSAGAEDGFDAEALQFTLTSLIAPDYWIVGAETTAPRTGAYSYRLIGSSQYMERGFGTADEIYMHFAIKFTAWDTNYNFLNFPASNISLRAAASGVMTAYRSTTSIATASGAMSLDTWHSIEVYHKPLDTGGRLQVWLDNVSVIDFTGDATASATSLTGVRWNGNTAAFYVDDIGINDVSGSTNTGRLNQPHFFPVRIKANGDANQFTRAGWDLGANSAQVREHAGGLSFLESVTVNNRDLFTIDAPDLPAGATINNLIWKAIARTGGGGRSIAPVLKVGSTEYEGSTIALASSWDEVQACYAQNPGTSSAWVESDLSSLQIGPKVK